MVSKLRIIWKQTVASDSAAIANADGAVAAAAAGGGGAAKTAVVAKAKLPSPLYHSQKFKSLHHMDRTTGISLVWVKIRPLRFFLEYPLGYLLARGNHTHRLP